MMDTMFYGHLDTQLQELKTLGLYKQEREMTSPQDAEITVDRIIERSSRAFDGKLSLFS
jgi:hypothetical protein